jgi:hypothetical protein
VTIPYLVQVAINRINLRLHLCADTMTAVTSFTADLNAAFNRSDDEQYDDLAITIYVLVG